MLLPNLTQSHIFRVKLRINFIEFWLETLVWGREVLSLLSLPRGELTILGKACRRAVDNSFLEAVTAWTLYQHMLSNKGTC